MSESNFFADVKVEGEDPFAILDQKTETPAESQPETKPEEAEPNQGEDTTKEPVVSTDKEDEPFHKRWKSREENLKREMDEKHQQDMEMLRQEIEQKFTPKQSETTIPKWFTTLYGENQEAWTEYQQYDVSRKDEIKAELVREQQEAITSAQDEEKRWLKWVDDSISELASTPGINFDLKDKNELIKTILTYKPTNENNEYDFKAGYELMQLQRSQIQPAVQDKRLERKRLADITTGSKGDIKSKDYMTPHDLRNKSWNNL